MRCDKCNYRNPSKSGFCKKCLKICNRIAAEKMINREPLPEGNTLRENLTAFMQDGIKGK